MFTRVVAERVGVEPTCGFTRNSISSFSWLFETKKRSEKIPEDSGKVVKPFVTSNARLQERKMRENPDMAREFGVSDQRQRFGENLCTLERNRRESIMKNHRLDQESCPV